MSYIKVISKKSDFISLSWYVGSVCNYACSYCNAEYHDGKRKFPDDLSPFTKFIEKLRDKYPNKRIYLSLYGGELTIWKKFPEFLTHCGSLGIDVRLITNGARNIQWWRNNADKLYSIIVSYHNEYADPDHIIEVMKIVQRGQVNILIPPENFNEILEIGKRISREAKVFVVPKFLRVNMALELYPYTDEQLKVFETNFGIEKPSHYRYYGFELVRNDGVVEHWSNTRQLFLKKINRWRGWTCWGGIDSFYIDYKMDLFVGQCRRGKFGNLKGDYVLPDEPFICDKETCNCAQDMMDTKRELF